MPRKVTQLEATEQPIRWGRAMICGAISSIFMMSYLDTYYMMGITPFTFEAYLGSLVFGYPYAAHVWTVGFLLNLLFGGLFGIFYAYCFEYVFKRTSTRLGIWIGVWHSTAAAVAFFPF